MRRGGLRRISRSRRSFCASHSSSIRICFGQQNIGSKETAMPTRRFERETLAQLLVGGCAAVFGVCVLFDHAQAQLSVPTGPIPAPPTQSPTFNPSNPGTVSQPSYQSLTPSTPGTTARSEQTSETRPVHRHHHYRGYYAGAGPTLGSFDCSYGWCVRISPPYAYYRPYGWYRY
jgi:hypothetical protein